MTDTVLIDEGTKILTKALGKVEAERFITLIIKEPFDYTKWRKNLYEDMSIDELSDKAMEFVNSKKG
ncbi:MAG: hypothetical protein FWF46_06565 [Oscillospiraceae bacterium]|nr:hypothetical protein [Oscillospiraceae bacterium]